MAILEISVIPGSVISSVATSAVKFSYESEFLISQQNQVLEASATEIWSALLSGVKKVVRDAGLKSSDISLVKLGEIFAASVFWDDETLGAVRDVIFDASTHEQRVASILQSDQQVTGTLAADRLVTGELREYLLSRLTRGMYSKNSNQVFTTDAKAFAGIAAEIASQKLPF